MDYSKGGKKVNNNNGKQNSYVIVQSGGRGGSSISRITEIKAEPRKLFYSDGDGLINELSLGADGTYLKSNGIAIAPSFATPALSGDVSKVGTPVDNQLGVWTGDGTIEGDVDLTFDTTTNTLSTVNIAVSGTVDGRDVAIDGTKLDGIEAGADVTDATNVAAAGAFMKAVDDTDDITVGATNKFATAAEKTKLGYITVTQAVDLDTMESDISNKQPLDSDLTTIAGLTATSDNFLQAKAGAWASRTVAQVKTDLGLTGTNSGDQTSIVGITGTTAEFNTALTDGDFATLTGAEDLTNKTLTAPKFVDLGFIADANGNEMLVFDSVASAINEITIVNAATGNGPVIKATGGDTNISLGLYPKGTGATLIGSQSTGKAGELRFYEASSNGFSYISMQASTSLAASYTLTLPSATGTVALVTTTSDAITTGTIELGHATDTTITRVSAGRIAVEGVNVVTTSSTDTLTNKTLSGATVLEENASLQLDGVLSADGTWSGTTITATAGYTQAFGDLVYLDPTDSRREAIDANAAAGADGDCRGAIGMVVVAGTDGNSCTILLNGTIRADANFPTFTVGGPIFASETAGDVTQTAPTTSGVVVKSVGRALTADSMYFNPSANFTIVV